MTPITSPISTHRLRRVRGIGAGLVCCALAGAAYAALEASDEEDPSKLVRIEGVRLTVFKGDRKAYYITAERGLMNEETRVVELERPSVEIHDESGAVKERIRGDSGRLWPVTVIAKDEKGVEKPTSKYDWELEGAIGFESVQGYEVDAEQIQFSGEKSSLASQREVGYRLPTGRGSVLTGRARQFEAFVDPGTSSLTKWKMTGPGEISIESEEAAAAPAGKSGAAEEGK